VSCGCDKNYVLKEDVELYPEWISGQGENKMKRTKEWWAALTKDERSELYWLERSQESGGGSAYIPDDCKECGRCGTPHLGYGLCQMCHNRLIELTEKAERGAYDTFP